MPIPVVSQAALAAAGGNGALSGPPTTVADELRKSRGRIQELELRVNSLLEQGALMTEARSRIARLETELAEAKRPHSEVPRLRREVEEQAARITELQQLWMSKEKEVREAQDLASRAERARLQLGQDDVLAQLRVAAAKAADAEEEQLARGADSDLHVIIFDEIDAICKARGSAGSGAGGGVHDTVVNQLLTKIDGVDALDNILLIGMTNRKDMLDDALLRPGRLEVQVEVGLPDERGRLQILKIHTSKMAASSYLAADVDLAELAAVTKNFSGAEIEGLVKSAASFALARNVDMSDLTKAGQFGSDDPESDESLKVTAADFRAALDEVVPAFGAPPAALRAHVVNGMLDCGAAHGHLRSTAATLVEQTRHSAATPLLTCLLEGFPGAGKTALAATVGLECGFPLVRLVSPDSVVGFGEAA